MLGVDGHGLRPRSGNKGISGQMVSLPEESPGALVDSSNSGVIEEVFFNSRNGEMMLEVLFHIFSVDAFQVASGHDS